jgi:hypothetical protein
MATRLHGRTVGTACTTIADKMHVKPVDLALFVTSETKYPMGLVKVFLAIENIDSTRRYIRHHTALSCRVETVAAQLYASAGREEKMARLGAPELL